MKVFTYIDWVLLLGSGVTAIVISALKTPAAYWLPAWSLQAALLVYALMRKDGGHWPSTLCGAASVVHALTVGVLLVSAGLSLDVMAQLLCGLIFVHGLLYLVAAKPFFIRRGWIKPAADSPNA